MQSRPSPMVMENASQLIMRNQGQLGRDTVLLINPPRDMLYRSLPSDTDSVRVSTQDHGDYRWLTASGAAAVFEAIPSALESVDHVIFFLPREKERLAMMLHALSSRMPGDSRLWLVGENRAGIKSAPRRLREFFERVYKIDAARHCGLFEAGSPIGEVPFTLDDYLRNWTIHHAGHAVRMVSLPGVFAHGRLDRGTRLLLKVLERLRPNGKVLDFACGGGVIGMALLTDRPSVQLTMTDVSALAIASSRQSLAANRLKAHLFPSDGLSEVTPAFDWIVSNPPFHRGVKNDLETAARFFAQAGTFLAKNGRILVVCNRHLPYERLLKRHFGQVNRPAEDREFRVIEASVPRHQECH